MRGRGGVVRADEMGMGRLHLGYTWLEGGGGGLIMGVWVVCEYILVMFSLVASLIVCMEVEIWRR